MESHLTPLVSVDLRSFSDRAAAWTAAHREHRGETRDRAMSLAAQARASEESQALLNTTTTPPPTTALPPTTAPPTTVPPTTVPPTTAPPTTVPPTTVPPTTVPPTTTTETDGAKGSDTDDETKSSTTTTTVPPSTTTATTTGPTEEQWEALRQCESTGNYRAISPGGRYRGTYQFSRSTWDWVAPQVGADHLVGVDPAEAAPADQDRMALALWEMNGWAPWPACSKRLGYL